MRVRIALLLLGLSGCSVVNAGRQASQVDACAPTLATGRAVAGAGATLTSVRRLTPEQANTILNRTGAPALVRPTAPPAPTAPAPTVTETPTAPGTARVCVLVYTGSFTRASLPPTPPATGLDTGRGLLVVVTARHGRLVAVSVLTSADSAR